jgi:hypothetical protein
MPDVAVIRAELEEGGADGSFELGDLGGEEFGADGEVFGGVLELPPSVLTPLRGERWVPGFLRQRWFARR